MQSSVLSHTDRHQRAYLVLCTSFVLIFVLSNLIAAKLIRFPGTAYALPAGVLTYPLTFLLSDLITEHFGSKRANFVLILAFIMNLVVLSIVQVVLLLPAHPLWANAGLQFGIHDSTGYQRAFEAVFSLNHQLLWASLVAYLCAQIIDVYLYSYLKRLTNGHHLWLRNNVSTMLSQVIDTAIVSSIYLFYVFELEFWTGMQIMLNCYAFKLIFALCDTPLMYGLHWALKRYLGEQST